MAQLLIDIFIEKGGVVICFHVLRAKTKGKLLFLYLVVSVVPTVFCPDVQLDQREISFDSLFPVTLEKKLFDSCMRLWGTVRIVNRSKQGDDRADRLKMLIVKQALFLLQMVDQVIEKHQNGIIMQPHDICYLIHIIEYMADECKSACNARVICPFLYECKSQLESLILVQ